jgi:hypothetical protein
MLILRDPKNPPEQLPGWFTMVCLIGWCNLKSRNVRFEV